MARPPLSIGTCGNITTTKTQGKWCAKTKYRDRDGVVRKVHRWSHSKSSAVNRLKEALSERVGPTGGEVTPDSKFAVVAEAWFQGIQRNVERGRRSPVTAELYRRQLDNYVLPALGELRVREVTVARVDGFISELIARRGESISKTVRTIVSGVAKEAMRHDAVSTNPARDILAIRSGQKKSPRALTPEQCKRWIRQLESDQQAVNKDLPDLTRFMLGTGVRVGEALAVLWSEVDLDTGTVTVEHTLVRVKGVGLLRKSTKSESGERTLRLPSWAIAMLRRRAEDGAASGPVFANVDGGWRDPSNTRRDLRRARGDEFAWVTSHVFRKTAATILDSAGLSAREVADQLGHARPSITQDIYLARKVASDNARSAMEALDLG